MIKFFCDRHYQMTGKMKEIEKPRYVLKDLSDPKKELLLCGDCMISFTNDWFYKTERMLQIDAENKKRDLKDIEKLNFNSINKEEPPLEAEGGRA